MSFRSLLAAAVLFGAVATTSAKECPTQDAALEAREEVIRKAPTCRRALQTMEACAYGASGDVALAAVVTAKCEADFLSHLDRRERQAYDRRVGRCRRKYRNEIGTMYRSFEAFCRAGVARDFSDQYRKARVRQ
jgi:hypothetical protein